MIHVPRLAFQLDGKHAGRSPIYGNRDILNRYGHDTKLLRGSSLPLVRELGLVIHSHRDLLGTDGDCGVHQPTVIIVEIVFQTYAIAVLEHHSLRTPFIVL